MSSSTVPLDRHCEQGLQKGYSIVEDLPFCRFLDHAQGGEREYRERDGENKTVCHWGQRKLLLSEIEFITKYYDKAKIVVYAGAAPGTHILCLAQLFPKLKFVLVDPRPFSSHIVKAAKDSTFGGSSRASIELRPGYFDDELAKEYAREEGVLFISDVRTSDDKVKGSAEGHGTTAVMDQETKLAYPTQQYVENDMELQQRWHVTIQPVASSFKFRLPWADGMTRYLKGNISLPVWGPVTTTESRLFVESAKADAENGNIDAQLEGQLTTYDNRKYERQMFYFNTHRRVAKYKHDYMEFYKCSCFDCTSEATILANYLSTVRASGEELPGSVPEMSTRLDRECHRDHQNPRTLFDTNPDPAERKERIFKRQKRR